MAATNSSGAREAATGAGEVVTSGGYEQMFIAELPTIESAIVFIARRHRLSADETDELRSLVHVKLIDDDYAILRKFEGRSSLRTFLTIVVRRLLLDSRTNKWGRWRPSVPAQREGAVAMWLERLMECQGLSFDQACAMIETSHTNDLDRTALEEIYERLPPARPRRYIVGEEAIRGVPAAANAEALVSSRDRRRVATHAGRVMATELARLSPDDQLMLRLRFVDGVTIGEIGRVLSAAGSPHVKVVYKRLRQVLDALRARLEALGLDRAQVLDMLGDPEVMVPRLLALRPGGRSRLPRARYQPSTDQRVRPAAGGVGAGASIMPPTAR